MRDRKAINADAQGVYDHGRRRPSLELEVLLDIRELLLPINQDCGARDGKCDGVHLPCARHAVWPPLPLRCPLTEVQPNV